MKTVTFNKRSLLVGIGLVAVLAGLLIAVTVLAAPLGWVTPLEDTCARTDGSCLQVIAVSRAGNDACARTDSACLPFTHVSAAAVAGNDSCARTDSTCLPFSSSPRP